MELSASLEQHFGFDQFRPPQEAVISSILNKRDVMVVMPTGGGKSLCYQLPAMLLPGVTVVVSPLIALMKDQVDALRAKNLPAGMINSTQSHAEQQNQIRLLREGALKLVYVAPERFRSQSFTAALGQCSISLVAVDEAHCLSQWGHDFRPDYLRIGESLRTLGSPQIAAFTATATPEVRSDILDHLHLRDPEVYVAGFARENLSFQVRHVNSESDKLSRIERLVREDKTGIIYCSTRKKVEKVAADLREMKVNLVIYHGGMDEAEREQAQNTFMSRRVDIAVATNAFGMGIDRSDIRFVVHYDMPGSIEAYYQEGGRAGRDGLPGKCVFLFNYADKRIQDFFIEGANPSKETIQQVYKALCELAENDELVESIDNIVESIEDKVNPMAVGTALGILARQGYIERFDVPGQRARGTRLLKPDVMPYRLEIDGAALRVKFERDEKKLNSVIDFAYSSQCRQKWILNYFGEKSDADCGRCDPCSAGASATIRQGTEAETLIVKKALSSVARMSTRLEKYVWQPRFGKRKIIQCLMGSRAEGIVKAGLDQLSTHGLLKEMGVDYLNELFREMETHRLLFTSDGEYRMMSLTEKGTRIMLGEESCVLDWPETKLNKVNKQSKSSSTATLPEGDYDTELYEKLKQKRTQLAAVRGGVPHYTIFPNKVLQALATLKPTDSEVARTIPGIGEMKAKKFLPTFLKIIQSHELANR